MLIELVAQANQRLIAEDFTVSALSPHTRQRYLPRLIPL